MSSGNAQDIRSFVEVLQISITNTDSQRKRRGGNYRVIIKHAHGTEETIRGSGSGMEAVIDCKTFIQLNAKTTIHIHRANQIDRDSDPNGSLDMTGGEEDSYPVKLNGKPGMAVNLKLGEKMTMAQVATTRLKDANEVLEKKSENAENIDRLTAHAKILVDALGVGSAFDPFPFAEGAVRIAKTALERMDRIPSEYKTLKDLALDCMSHIELDGDARKVFTTERVRKQLNSVMALVLQVLDFIVDYYSQSQLIRFMFKPSDSTIKGVKDLALNLEKQKGLISLAFQLTLGEGQHGLHDGQLELRQTVLDSHHQIMEQIHRSKPGETEKRIPSISQEKDGWVFVVDPTEADLLKKFLGAISGPTTGKDPCLPGTRVSILATLSSWAKDDAQGTSRLFWVYGVAGCGKSAVAASISKALNKDDRLAGSFFCRRDEGGRRNPVQLFGHLASCLAEHSPDFKKALVSSLERYAHLDATDKHTFFEYALKDPLSDSKNSALSTPVAFLIDALDECNDSGTVARFLAEIVGMAPWIKLIVTSRELADIKNVFYKPGVENCDLFVDSESKHDIHEYLRMRLNKSLEPLRDKLAEKSGGLFIWLHTVTEVILSSKTGREKKIQAFLDQPLFGGAEERMATTYLTVLEVASGSSETDRTIVQHIIGLLLATSSNAPLTISGLYAFLPPGVVENVSLHEFGELVLALKPVLKLTSVEDVSGMLQYDYLVQTHHTSFLDFCAKREIPYETDSDPGATLSNPFWTNPITLHRDMAISCFEIMKKGKWLGEPDEVPLGLRFNICGLETSHKLNSEVDDLQERIATRIPPHLLYSSTYWASHLFEASLDKSTSTGATNLEAMLADFLQSTCSLFWLEVLSLTGNLSMGVETLVMIAKQADATTFKHSAQIAYEMCRFVEQCFPAISSSTPHLYLSIMWIPVKSLLWTAWRIDSELSRASILKTPIQQPSELLSSTPFPMRVDTFTISPDERHVISGSQDGYVRLWNLHSTHIPVRERQVLLVAATICSVAYVPDGSYILCVCNGFIYKLDTETLDPVQAGTPLSFTDTRCMAVSEAHIAIGTEDGGLVVLDAETYSEVWSQAAQMHAVNAIALSPDGTRFIYAADGVRFCVWDASSRSYRPVDRLLEERNHVTTAAFSRDGRTIATGDLFGRVRLFDAESNELRGSFDVKYLVQFLTFSYGTRIICAFASKRGFVHHSENLPPSSEGSRHYISDISLWAEETSLQIWDVNFSCHQLENSFSAGHTDHLTSVAFSPNSKKVVSGSRDCSVRVWNAETCQPEKLAEMKHSGWVLFVTFSPDGQSIASGGNDSVIRIWEAHTGKPLQVLEGHSGEVSCGVYSSDGTSFVSGSNDRTLRIWDIEKKHRSRRVLDSLKKAMHHHQASVSVLSGHDDSLMSVSFSPDGSCIASASWDSTIRLWDTKGWKPFGGDSLSGHHGTLPSISIAFSKEGSRLVSGGYDDTVCIWDVNTRIAIGEPLRGHTNTVTSVTLSPDGDRIFSASLDGTIRCWDVITGKSIGHPLEEDPDVFIYSLAISPDGQRIVSGSENGCIRIWDPEAFKWELEESFISCGHRGPDRIPDHIPGDGWIQTSEGALLLWVPVEYRAMLCRRDIFSISNDARKGHNRILWDRLCHGEKWMDIDKAE